MTKPPRKHIEVRDALQPELFRYQANDDPNARVVWAFDESERRIQAEALRALRSIRFPMPLATGAMPGMTLAHNVLPHRGGRKFWLTDFVDAYGRVQKDVLREKVDDILRGEWARGKSHRWARDIISAYMEEGAFLEGVPGLPQGSATSADLFNWYMAKADNNIAFMFQQNRRGEVATRYLDDLTVSSPYQIGVSQRTRRSIRTQYQEFAPGMEFSHPKSHVWSLTEDQPITITGLSLYADGRITPSPKLLKSATGVFGEMARKLAEGEPITDEDYAYVAGYNGVLHLPGETGRSGSRTVREMGATARELMAQMKPRIQKYSQVKQGSSDHGRSTTFRHTVLVRSDSPIWAVEHDSSDDDPDSANGLIAERDAPNETP